MAFDLFVETYGIKYEKAVAKLMRYAQKLVTALIRRRFEVA